VTLYNSNQQLIISLSDNSNNNQCACRQEQNRYAMWQCWENTS